MKDLGRIDYRSRRKVWSVVWYVGGYGEKVIGSFATQKEAVACLRNRLEERRATLAS